MAGRSEKSHVVMYSRNGDVDQRAWALVAMSPWVDEEVGRMSGSMVPREDSRREKKKNIVDCFKISASVLFLSDRI